MIRSDIKLFVEYMYCEVGSEFHKIHNITCNSVSCSRLKSKTTITYNYKSSGVNIPIEIK